MAFRIQATCSECAWQEELFVDEEDETVTCPQCGHTSPNFDPDDFEQIQSEQQKTQLNLMIAGACLGGLLLSFLLFTYGAAPNVDLGGLPDGEMPDKEELQEMQEMEDQGPKKEINQEIYALLALSDLPEGDRSFFKYIGIGGMLISLCALMFFGVSASKEHVVCEF